jgi:hypothetical protein
MLKLDRWLKRQETFTRCAGSMNVIGRLYLLLYIFERLISSFFLDHTKSLHVRLCD